MSESSNKGLIVTVCILSIILFWFILFSILALALKNKTLYKLSIIGPVGHNMHDLIFEGKTIRGKLGRALQKRADNLIDDDSAQPSEKVFGGFDVF